MTAEPPLFVGGVKEIVASVFPTATVTDVGGSGIVEGVTALEAFDGSDVPIPFVAVTLKVYTTPLIRPFMSHVSVPTLEIQVPAITLPAVNAVTVYPLIAEPFVLTGASQDTVADASAATAVTLIGTDGAAFIATSAEASEASEVPAVLVAVTLNV